MRHLIAITVALLIATSIPALASETVFNRAAQSGVSEITLDTYSRMNSTFVLDHKNAELGGDATATIVCGADGANRWSVQNVSGTCWNTERCQSFTLQNYIAEYEFHEQQDYTSVTTNFQTGLVTACNSIEQPATLANVTIEEISNCTTSTMADPKEKGLCVWDNNSPAQISADTGDDMFKMLPATGAGNGAYIEYPAIGDIDNPLRLRWIERGTGGKTDKAIMIPSGPPGSFKDFELFLQNPPQNVARSEPACYPVKATLCAGAPDMPEAPPALGLCGNAHNKSYETADEVIAAGLCRVGQASAVAGDEEFFTWSCASTPSTEPAAQCRADVIPPDTSEKPGNSGNHGADDQCYVQAVGMPSRTSPCNGTNQFCLGYHDGPIRSSGDIVGAGDYPFLMPPGYHPLMNVLINPPFSTLEYPFTFSGGVGTSAGMSGGIHNFNAGWGILAVGPDAQVTIYENPNFQGRVLYQTSGPLYMVDPDKQQYMRDAFGSTKADWDGTNTPWAAPHHSTFPSASRILYAKRSGMPHMQNWPYTGSMKVTCSKPQSYWAYDTVYGEGQSGPDGIVQSIKLVWEGETIFQETRRCAGCTVTANRSWIDSGYPALMSKTVGAHEYLRGERLWGTEPRGVDFVGNPNGIGRFHRDPGTINFGQAPKNGIVYYAISRNPLDDGSNRSCTVYAALYDGSDSNPSWRFVSDGGSGPYVLAGNNKVLERSYSTDPEPYYNHPLVNGSVSSLHARAMVTLENGQTATFVTQREYRPTDGGDRKIDRHSEDEVTCINGHLDVVYGAAVSATDKPKVCNRVLRLGTWSVTNHWQCLKHTGTSR